MSISLCLTWNWIEFYFSRTSFSLCLSLLYYFRSFSLYQYVCLIVYLSICLSDCMFYVSLSFLYVFHSICLFLCLSVSFCLSSHFLWVAANISAWCDSQHHWTPCSRWKETNPRHSDVPMANSIILLAYLLRFTIVLWMGQVKYFYYLGRCCILCFYFHTCCILIFFTSINVAFYNCN